MFTKSGLKCQSSTDQGGPTQRVLSSYELTPDYQKTVKELINEWTAMCHLYSIVTQSKDMFNGENTFKFTFIDLNLLVQNRC